MSSIVFGVFIIITIVSIVIFNFYRKYKKYAINKYNFKFTEELEQAKMREFTGAQLFQYQATVAVQKLVHAGTRVRKRENREIDGADGAFEEELPEKIALLIDKHVLDIYFRILAFKIVDIMILFNIDKQPSVNMLKKSDREICIPLSSEKYEKLATVSLMQHTYNVLLEYDNFIDKVSRPLNDKISIELLFFACFLHDIGKSITLAEYYGLDVEKMKIGKYSHSQVGSDIFMLIVKEETELYKNEIYINRILQISKIIREHHYKDFNIDIIHHVTPILKQLDKLAREKEILRIENREMEKEFENS